MKISSRARHAVRLVLEIARFSDGRTPVQLSEVARVTGLSRRFLEQIAIALKSHALLVGVCGRNGGYLLARPSEKITIGDVLAAVIGPIQLAACADAENLCMSSEFCTSRKVWALVQKRVNDVLDEYTIADLLDSRWLQQVDLELSQGL